MNFEISMHDQVHEAEILDIYRANDWSSAQKPVQLMAALRHSHSLVTARQDGQLIGLGNAISDGHLVVYFPHLLVHPDFQNLGAGRLMMQAMLFKYKDLHQKILVAEHQAIKFYQSMGFVRAGQTKPMWIYAGTEH